MDILRTLNLSPLLAKKSHFLLGPRSTGKSALIKKQLQGQAFLIDLLESDLFLRLSANPSLLEFLVEESRQDVVVIDEIQKIPLLLDEAHRLIERKKIRFLLTGSSARKLKKSHTNLLAGRARMANLFPLTWQELRTQFDLNRYLLFGGLPQVYLSDEPQEELVSYANLYVKEEIQSEALIRSLPPFSRFLVAAALSNGQIINFTKVGDDAQVSPSTVREYYSILEDTLMGFLLPPFTRTKKRKAIQTAKFYFFDIGVVHTLVERKSIPENTEVFGDAFEHFLGMELRAYLSYTRKLEGLSYWRSVNRQEVDYLIGQKVAIEVKATKKFSKRYLRGLMALQEEGIFEKYFFVSRDPLPQHYHNVRCLPWQEFLKRLWGNEIF